MATSFEGKGTVTEVLAQVHAAGKAPENSGAVPTAALAAAADVLQTAGGDRQATVNVSTEVRGTELTKAYVDITIVPSAATQEARAEADRPKPVDEPDAG